MNEYYLAFFFGGVLVGWITKTPFLLSMYTEWKEEQEMFRKYFEEFKKNK